MKRGFHFLVFTVGLCSCHFGCGSAAVLDFPARLVGAEGQVIVLEDLEAIATDPNLDDDAKRQQFRDLGIEDEDLISALLGFG